VLIGKQGATIWRLQNPGTLKDVVLNGYGMDSKGTFPQPVVLPPWPGGFQLAACNSSKALFGMGFRGNRWRFGGRVLRGCFAGRQLVVSDQLICSVVVICLARFLEVRAMRWCGNVLVGAFFLMLAASLPIGTSGCKKTEKGLTVPEPKKDEPGTGGGAVSK